LTVNSASGSVGGYPRGRVPFDIREQQILLVAQQLFASNGYDATGIVDIARAAGVTRPVVYKHFESKEAIYLAVLREARRELMAQLTSAITGEGEPEDQIRVATDAYFRYVERNQPAWEILFGDGAAAAGPAADEAARLRAETIQFIAGQIRRLSRDADPLMCEALAHGLSGSAEQIARWWRHHPQLERRQVVDYHMSFTWPGLAALLPRRTGPA
jgi:AcrR family transcriptional regulator